MSKFRTILICGFMGAGKSTLLAAMEGNPAYSKVALIDLDTHLEKRVNKSIATLISESGLENFRAIEAGELESLIKNSESDQVIALGGGTLNFDTAGLLENDSVKALFLNTPFELCYERIRGDLNRPLAQKSFEELKALYRSRLTFYEMANVTLTYEEIALLNFDSILSLCDTICRGNYAEKKS